MKKNIRVAGMLATLSAAMTGSAYAQSSVTIYGIADAGVIYKTGAGAHGGNSTSVASGVESTDRWGFRGTEDLGGGLKATFNLENGYRINTGQGINGSQPTTSSVLFDRGATVGLESQKLGSVQLGRNWSPFHDSLAAIDVSGFINFGSLNTISYQNGSGYNGAQYYWIDNSVKYTTPKIAGFTAVGLYGLGGTAGDFSSKSVISARLSYQLGIATLDGAYFHGRDLTGVTDRSVAQAYTIGAKVVFDKWRLAADMTNFKNPSNGASQNFYTAEAVYRLTPTWNLSGAYIRLDDRANGERDASLYRFVVDYFFSKATNLYAAVGYVKNNSLGTLGILNSTPAGGPGENQFAAAVGIRHLF
ncbi:porin [Paraburkholderia fungorum]|uniref:porin n=1 Tax=Paraburkholderia fungorum TaxID=134537 RepID=UPI0038BAC6C1